MSSREERANTLVAEVLGKLLGMEVRAETSGRVDRKLPDIEIPAHKAVLEAKYDDFDAAVKAARGRWTNMNPPPAIVGALSYHPSFKKDIKQAIRRDDSIEFALSGDRHADLHSLKRTGTVYDLAQSLRRPAAILHPDRDEIEQAVGSIEGALAMFYGTVRDNPGLLDKFARILQANFEKGKEEETLEQSARVAGLILFGAFLFQFALALKDNRVQSPSLDSLSALSAHWKMILSDINYAAIFGVARRILDAGVLRPHAEALLDAARDVQTLAKDGTDLMGRIYHRLLADAKPLGAFYTSIPAATMIAGLALSPKDWGSNSQWADLDFVRKFRIADPACGSGTLLAAACWQMRDNFARADFRERGVMLNGKKSPLDDMQKCLLEEIIWGYDILETAGHLTATTLGLMSPGVDFRHAHIYRTLIGDTTAGAVAGSLELLEGTPMFNRHEQVETAIGSDEAPELDLCIMNPPFVRGTIGNESFSFLSPAEQEAVHNRIRTLGKKHCFVSDKGQGPAFVALACQQARREFRIKDGGRIAVILPSTLATGMGKAWCGAREKIEKHFDLEMLIVSRESGRPNFSENTNLQECIAVARKRKNGDKANPTTLFVALSRNPRTVEEALATARAIKTAQKDGGKIGDLRIDGESGFSGIAGDAVGQYAVLPWHGKAAWRNVAFANLSLAFAVNTFSAEGSLRPFVKGKVPLKPLKELAASIGSHRLNLYLNARIVKDRRCRLSPTITPYAGYYPSYYRQKTGMSQKDLRQIAEKPQCYILPLSGHEMWAEQWYAKAGRVAICQSFGFSTMRRLAVLVSEQVQATCYWPVKLRNETEEKLKAMTLWLNSSPSLLLIANSVQTTQGVKSTLVQQSAKGLPVLDLDALDGKQLRKLAAVFDEIAAGDGFLPIPHLTHDPARIKVDAAISEVCGIGDLAPLRAALAVEPIITNKPAGVAAGL